MRRKKKNNAETMRDALAALVRSTCAHCANDAECHKRGALKCKAVDDAEAALVTAPRNCDVGTPQEQHRRFCAMCERHHNCRGCPLADNDGDITPCEVIWGQMPYGEEGGEE